MISIIIPTYNAEKYLVNLLNSIKNQSLNKYELIIVDSSSKDESVNIAKNYTDNIIVVLENQFDHGGTRAMAAQYANGEYLVYLTHDAIPFNDQAIEKLVEVFKDKTIGASFGRQVSYIDTDLFGKHLREFNYTEQSYVRNINDKDKYGVKTAQLSNSFAAYRKDALMETGNFKDGLILGEDVYTGAKMLQAGYKLAYVADAKVYHSHSYTISQEFKRYFDIGVFHKCEEWILDEFGKPEGEGMKYVLSEIHYLLNNGAWYLLPEFLIRNGMKYSGYLLGKKYEILPMWAIKKFSMHRQWWSKYCDI